MKIKKMKEQQSAQSERKSALKKTVIMFSQKTWRIFNIFIESILHPATLKIPSAKVTLLTKGTTRLSHAEDLVK